MRRRFIQNNAMSKPNYMYIEALEDGLTASFSTNALEYSMDGSSWEILADSSATPSVNTGDRIYFRATRPISASNIEIGTFTISKACNIGGNAMSLLFGEKCDKVTDLSIYENVFRWLFRNCSTIHEVGKGLLPATKLAVGCYDGMFSFCTSLVNAPELPATTLSYNCYNSMFYGCTSLTTAPELPATTLVSHCYRYMFYGCTSLVNAPELPATTLSYNCYYDMFSYCTSLVNAPELSATQLENYCYYNMFSYCTSLVNAPKLPATTLDYYCYAGMFSNCTSLTVAPELPATTLSQNCYQGMFSNCINLNYIKMLATDISANYCLNGWTSGVASTGTFVKNKDATWDVVGDSGVPTGWTVIDDTFPTNEDGFPESTEFSFPLYLNFPKEPVYEDEYGAEYELGGDVVSALCDWVENLTGNYYFDSSKAIFINGTPVDSMIKEVGYAYVRGIDEFTEVNLDYPMNMFYGYKEKL